MAARDFGPWDYATHDGEHFRRRGDKFITTQATGAGDVKVGGAAATGTVKNAMPRNYRPRMWHGSEIGTGHKGSVVIYAEDAPLWTDDALTVDVRDGGGTSHTLTLDRRTDERTGRHISSGQ